MGSYENAERRQRVRALRGLAEMALKMEWGAVLVMPEDLFIICESIEEQDRRQLELLRVKGGQLEQ